MKEFLKLFAEEMQKLNIDYDYLEWKSSPVPSTYVIGEYSETNYSYETNTSEGEMLVTIWNRVGSIEDVVDVNETLKNHFKDFKIVKNNIAISISYYNALPVMQEDNIRKQEVRFDVSYWEGEK